MKEKSGKLKKYVIEIKPKKQTLPPVKKKRVTKGFIAEAKTYAVNQAKWSAATDFALDNGCEFKIITEDELGIKTNGTRGLSGKRHTKSRKPGR